MYSVNTLICKRYKRYYTVVSLMSNSAKRLDRYTCFMKGCDPDEEVLHCASPKQAKLICHQLKRIDKRGTTRASPTVYLDIYCGSLTGLSPSPIHLSQDNRQTNYLKIDN